MTYAETYIEYLLSLPSTELAFITNYYIKVVIVKLDTIIMISFLWYYMFLSDQMDIIGFFIY